VGNLWSDLRYALRMLRKNPGVTLAAMLTLALGLSANITVFSFANAYLLRPLNFEQPEQLVHIWQTNRRQGYSKLRASLPNVLDWKQHNSTLADVGVFNYTGETLQGSEGPERISGGRVSANVFGLLGVQPALGRGFAPGEDEPGRGAVAVLSHHFWQQRYAADTGVLGKTITVGDGAHTIIGVMPVDFVFPLPTTQLWLPRELDTSRHAREQGFLQVVARLKPGVTRAQAQADLTAIAARLEAEYPRQNESVGVNVTPLKGELNFAYDIFQILAAVMGGSGAFLLLIACGNVASLTIARGLGRTREFAVRAALGAARSRIVRQLLTENLLVALGGGVLGLLMAAWSLQSAAALIPDDLYRVGDLGIDTSTAVFTLALCSVTTLLFGLAPALQVTRHDLNLSLREGGAGAGASFGRRRMHNVLAASQIAMSLVLLVGAGLFTRSMANLSVAPLGFETDSVMTMQLSLPAAQYNSTEKIVAFHRALLREAGAVPGVTAAATVNYLPLNHETASAEFQVEGEAAPTERANVAIAQYVSPDYFRVMGIPFSAGRAFGEGDTAATERVVVVSEALAAKFFPAGDAVGRRLLLRRSSGELLPASIVGVAGNVKHQEIDETSSLLIYQSQFQAPWTYLRLVTRTTPEPALLAGALRSAIGRVDPTLPVTEVRTLAEVVHEYLLPRRVMSGSMALFAVQAVILATVGLFGVVAFSVAQRTREMGIRVALGAQRGDILRLVLRQGWMLGAAGVGAGLAASLGVGQLLSSLLYGVSAFDPLTLGAAAAFLMGVALLASYLPARRAARTDPMVALRYE